MCKYYISRVSCGDENFASIFNFSLTLVIGNILHFFSYLRAGGIIDNDSSLDHLIRVPPLSIRLRQNIVEKLVKEGDGETKRTSQLQSELFALSAQVTNDTMNLVCFDILTSSDSASSGAYCDFSMMYSLENYQVCSFSFFLFFLLYQYTLSLSSNENRICNN